MLSNSTLAALMRIARPFQKSAFPALANVYVDAFSYRVTDLYQYVEVTPLGGTGFTGDPMCVPSDWLAERVRLAGTGRKATPIRLAGGQRTVMVTATVGTSKHGAHGLLGEEFPAFPEPQYGPEQPLVVSDFDKGGPVATAALSASRDYTRPHVNAVLFDGCRDPKVRPEAVATNGHKLARCPMLSRPSRMLVPLDAIGSLLALVAATSPIALSVIVGPVMAHFSAVCPDGTAWRFTVRLADEASFPAYKQVDKMKGDATVVMVDAAEVVGLVRPYGKAKDARVAIFADGGLVAWCGYDETAGVAISCETYPDGDALTVLDVAELLRMLPAKVGPVEIAVHPQIKRDDGKEVGGPVEIDGTVLMPIAGGVPAFVQEELAIAFGRAQRIATADHAAALAKRWGEILADKEQAEREAVMLADPTQNGFVAIDAAVLAHARVTNLAGGTFLEIPGVNVGRARADGSREPPRKPYTLPEAHLGPPTAEDMKRAHAGLLDPGPEARKRAAFDALAAELAALMAELDEEPEAVAA